MTYATDTDWLRRYEANEKVPPLPDDPDVDHALSQLRREVDEIAERASVSSVVRILRHRQGLAAEVLRKAEPTCLSCGGGKVCLGCDDTRPRADRLAPGWQFMSPMNRWETVERVEQANEYAPVRVWTDKTGPDYSWLIPQWRQLDAIAPPWRPHGTPEIRVVEYQYDRSAPMYAVITLDTVYRPDNDDPVAEAHYSRETGWKVTHRPGGGDMIAIDCGRSKAKARTALRAAARQHAKALGVKVTEQPKDGGR
ncbi:hypothetical protein GCM10029963_53540 [Micromonospora andamanensis]|uniref:hypothetical protein n=1 Tax=Micromonospora andamanensis TaxID=1287068 RepID=UPI00194E8127|nr:hypothetical protein [Micromonospora andamanensis]GIJ36715.1 hypothetical protein Vwe01_00400 [Micromonospora andamanensis]